MKTEKIAEKAMAKLIEAIGDDLSKKQLEQVRGILSELSIEVAKDTAKHCTKRAAELYGPRTDLAADIADEIKRTKVATIANLESMR